MPINLGFGSSKSTTKESSKSTGRESYKRGNVSVEDLLTELIESFNRTSTEDIQANSISAAQRDVGGVVDSIFQNYRETALPEIFNTAESAGVFGNTSSQKMANDAFARATSQAAELTLGTANTYANQRMQGQAQLEQLLAQLFNIDIQQSGSGTTFNKSEGTSTTRQTQVQGGVASKGAKPGAVQF